MRDLWVELFLLLDRTVLSVIGIIGLKLTIYSLTLCRFQYVLTLGSFRTARTYLLANMTGRKSLLHLSFVFFSVFLSFLSFSISSAISVYKSSHLAPVLYGNFQLSVCPLDRGNHSWDFLCCNVVVWLFKCAVGKHFCSFLSLPGCGNQLSHSTLQHYLHKTSQS